MSAKLFIDKLEASSLLDDSVIGKLRRKISKPGKAPSADAVASYCLNKGFLTQTQATKLLESIKSAATETAQQVTTVSASDLIVEEPVQANEVVDEIVDLSANPYQADPAPGNGIVDLGAQGIQPLGDPAQPLTGQPLGASPLGATPAQPLGSPTDPYATGNGGAATEAQSAEKEEKKFQGKKFEEQSFESRWIILGSFLLVALLVAGWFFWTVLSKGSKDEVFDNAERLFADQSYAASIEAYKEFIKNFKGDPNTNKAHTRYRQAEIKVAISSNDVDHVIEVFKTKTDEISNVLANMTEETSFKEDVRATIATDLIGYTQKAANASASVEEVGEREIALNKVRKLMQMVEDGSFVPRSEREKPAFAAMIEGTHATINKVNNSIVREKDTVAAVQQITEMLAADKTYDAFQVYDQLITNHAIADSDARVIKCLADISSKEEELVVKIDPNVTGFSDADLPISTALVNRIKIPTLTGAPVKPIEGANNTLAKLVAGSVYGIDLATGKIKWRHFVGHETNIEPVWLDDPLRVLLSDQKNNRLMLVHPDTGEIVWQKMVGETFMQPTVSRNKIIVSMHSGKVARVDSETGSVAAIVQLPQKLNVPATTNASGNVIYQVGEHLNLYVLSVSLSDITCVQAYYLGHRDGQIRVAPTFLQNILIVAINTTPNKCRLELLMNESDSLKLQVAGSAKEVNGNIVKPPVLSGNTLVLVTDRGELEVVEIASNDEKQFLASIAKKSLNIPVEQEIFVSAHAGKIWVGTKGIVQYNVIRPKEMLKDMNVSNTSDFFTGEMNAFEELVVHVRVRAGSRMTSVAAVDPSSLEEKWRLDIAGGLAGPPIVNNEQVTAVNSQGDFYPLDDAVITSGLQDKPVLRASRTQQNLVFDRSVDFGDGTGFFLGPIGRKHSISYIPDNKTLPVNLYELKIQDLKITSRPISFMNGILVGMDNGEVRHILPRSVKDDAVFVPQAKVDEEFNWQSPCVVSNDTFIIASLNGRIFSVKYVPNNGTPYMSQVLESNIGRKVIMPLKLNGDTVYTMGDGPNGNELVAINRDNLKVKGSFPLGGISTWGPENYGDLTLVTKDDGTLLAFGDDISKPKWETKLPSGRATGPVLNWKGKMILTLKDGQVLIIDPASADRKPKILEIGEPLAENSVISGDRLFVSGFDGTISVMDLSKVQ